MLKKWVILGLICGACQSDMDEEPSWFDGWQPGTQVVEPQAEDTHYITVELAQGAMTFPARDAQQNPLTLRDGVTWYEGEQPALYFTDGHQLLLLNPQTLALESSIPFVDATGEVVEVLGLYRITYEGTPLLLTHEAGQIRIFDWQTETLSVPVLMLTTDVATGAVVPFEAQSLAIVQSLEGLLGTPFLATNESGALFVGQQTLYEGGLYLFFSQVRPAVQVCGRAETIRPQRLLAPTFKNGSAMWTETIMAVTEEETWVLDAELCLYPSGLAVDENNDAIHPLGGFDVDFEGDGVDTIVWVHQ